MPHIASLHASPLAPSRAAVAHAPTAVAGRPSLARRGASLARILLMPGAAAEELRALPGPRGRDRA